MYLVCVTIFFFYWILNVFLIYFIEVEILLVKALSALESSININPVLIIIY